MPLFKAAVKLTAVEGATVLSRGQIGNMVIDHDLTIEAVPGGTRLRGAVDAVTKPLDNPLFKKLQLPYAFDFVAPADLLGSPFGSVKTETKAGTLTVVWERGEDKRLRVSGHLVLLPEHSWFGTAAMATGAAREIPLQTARGGLPKRPSDVIGYGISYSWAQADHALLCETLASSGCNATDIEYMAMTPVSEHGYRTGGAVGLRSRYLSLLGEVRKRDMLLIVSVINDNMHIKKWLNSGHHDLKHFPAECDRACEIVLEQGPNNQWVQLVAEIQTSLGRAFEKKWAPRFIAAGFNLIWNDKAGRPESTPTGYFTRSYHACKLSDLGNGANIMLIPDCGAAINAYTTGGNFNSGTGIKADAAADYAYRGRKAGRGVCIYSGTGIKKVPAEAIREIGKRAGVGTKF